MGDIYEFLVSEKILFLCILKAIDFIENYGIFVDFLQVIFIDFAQHDFSILPWNIFLTQKTKN